MSERIGVRALRNDVAAVIRRARRGERLVVTVDGRPVAQLGPLEPTSEGVELDDLIAAGLVDPPNARSRPGAALAEPLAVDTRVDRVLEELRGR